MMPWPTTTATMENVLLPLKSRSAPCVKSATPGGTGYGLSLLHLLRWLRPRSKSSSDGESEMILTKVFLGAAFVAVAVAFLAEFLPLAF